MTPIGVLRQCTTEAMMKIFIIYVGQGGWGSAPREVDQPGWAVLAVLGS